MEAGAATGPAAAATGDAGAADGQVQQGEQTQEQSQQTAQPDYAALQEQLSEFGSSMEEIRSILSSGGAQPQEGIDPAQAAAEPEAVPDLGFLDPASPLYDPARAGERMLEVIQAQNQQAIEAAVKPVANQLEQTQRQLAAQELVAEFPDLADDAVAQKVLQASNQWVQAAGLPPEAAQSPQVWRAVYLMSVAAELQQREQESPQAATLEGASGASPAGGSPSAGMTADEIFGSSRGRSVLPFG